MATHANIVTPISSLIVLETDQDYKNNNIEKNINTLGNASIDDKPATPLTYQWFVILIGLALGFFSLKRRTIKPF